MRWDIVTGQFRVYELGGGGGGSQTSTQVNYSPEEAARRAQVMDEAQRIYNATAGTIAGSPYPGAAPVTPSADTQMALTLGRQTAFALTPYLQQQMQYSNWLQSPEALNVSSNPYLQDAIGAATRPIQQAYTDPNGVFSQIRTGASGAGQYGSSRQGIAEGIAGRGYLTAVGDVSTNMAYKNYGDAQDRALKAVGMAPSIAQAATLPTQILDTIGAEPESYEQAWNDYNANSRMWDLNAPWAPLQNYANIVFGGSTPSTTSTSSAKPSTGARLAGGIGAAASGAAIASSLGMSGPVGAGIGLLMSLL